MTDFFTKIRTWYAQQSLARQRSLRIASFIIVAAVIFSVLAFFLTAEWWTSIGEFLIAAVIYYELEENRVATFLEKVQSPKFLEERREIYKAYVTASSSASLKTRADEFRRELNADPVLRSKVDVQWSNIDRLQYALRWSLFHRYLLAEWFPQVLISLWVMTGPYVRKLQAIRLHDAHEYGVNAVRESVDAVLSKQKKAGSSGPITIYGASTDPLVEIPAEMIQAMQHDLDAPFK